MYSSNVVACVDCGCRVRPCLCELLIPAERADRAAKSKAAEKVALAAAPTQGRKDDQGKDPWHLIPFDAVRAICKVLNFGAAKYAPRNWEKGMDWSRPYSALMRHMASWWEGEAKDPETGFSHLWHAGCCILFLIAFELRGKGKDDRPKKDLDD